MEAHACTLGQRGSVTLFSIDFNLYLPIILILFERSNSTTFIDRTLILNKLHYH
ncbi:hypothetical protein ACN4EE_23340 [Geminocystis sp. CENA526]